MIGVPAKGAVSRISRSSVVGDGVEQNGKLTLDVMSNFETCRSLLPSNKR